MTSESVHDRCHALLDALTELEPVLRGRIWDRFPGKERVYIDLVKLDGDPTHNAGVGHTMFVDVHTGFTCFDKTRNWAGHLTQRYHQGARTIQRVKDVTYLYIPKGDAIAETIRLELLRTRS